MIVQFNQQADQKPFRVKNIWLELELPNKRGRREIFSIVSLYTVTPFPQFPPRQLKLISNVTFLMVLHRTL